ncbi:hypothetical protein K440DRAFT_23905 [Wilcoxina mikolae CBS 423.85]|nr:hypothetical protein K440DRAFT_23905 [Wilcoxina mikolae CBS 423.85]
MAKDKKVKTTPEANVDLRLYDLVGLFLKEAGLSSSAKIFEAETSRKVKKSTALPKPASLGEALKAWDKTMVKAAAEEDSGNESEDESSDSGEETPDSSDDESDAEAGDDSSVTVSGDDKKAKEGKEEKKKKKEDKSDER